MFAAATALLAAAAVADAHIMGWHKGMYCLNGTTAGVDDANKPRPSSTALPAQQDRLVVPA